MYEFRQFNPTTDKNIVYLLINSIFEEFDLVGEFHKNYLITATNSLCELLLNAKEGDTFKENLWVLFNTESNEIVGTIGLEVLPSDIYGENSVELKRCYLRKEERRAGLGEKLIKFVEKRAKELNFSKVFVFSSRNFKGAQTFYPKHGYVLVRQNDSEWNDNEYCKSL